MIAFVGSNAALGIGPEPGRDYMVAAASGQDVVAALERAGHRGVVALEDEAADRARADDPSEGATVLSGAWVLRQPRVHAALREAGVRAVIPFKPSSALLSEARRERLEVLASDAKLVRQLENKLSLPGIAALADAPHPRSIPAVLGEGWRRMVDDDGMRATGADMPLAFPVVFQPAVGFAGDFTCRIDGPEDLERLSDGIGQIAGKFAEYVDGEPCTINGVVGKDAIFTGGIARQLTGVPACTSREFGSCGNEWSLPLPADRADAVRALCERVGHVLRDRGFLGLFGIDVVVTADGVPWLIEVNPRWTASLSLALQLQQLHDPVAGTLYDAHCHAFGHGAGNPLPAYDGFEAPAPAASVIVYNRELDPLHPATALPCGVYAVAGGAPVRVRDGYRFEHLERDEEFLVFAQPPHRRVASGQELCRLVFRRRVAHDERCRDLDADALAVISAVRAALQQQPAPAAR